MSGVSRTRNRLDQTDHVLGTYGEIDRYGVEHSAECIMDYCLRDETCVDEIHPKHPYEGGEFELRRMLVTLNKVASAKTGSYYYSSKYKRYVGTWYDGTYVLKPYVYQQPASAHAACASQGASAWNRFKPARPDVSLAVAIAELREAPQLIFKKLDKFRNYGNNYLAVEFGWKPFLSDLRRWWNSMYYLDRYAARLLKNQDKWVRRGGTFSSDTDSASTEIPGAHMVFPPNNITAWGPLKITTTTSNLVWFKGLFRYHIPGLDSPYIGKFASVMTQWDLTMSPAVIWELTPWSWLFDWFANVGDVLSNLQSAWEQDMVAHHAYVMQRSQTIAKFSQDFTARFMATQGTYTYTTYNVESTVLLETKDRCEADPFGFTFGLTPLTMRQLGILAALGISRLKY